MTSRAFPVVYARRVPATVGFYERLGFRRHFQFPAAGDPTYVGLRRDADGLGVVAAEWPRDRYGAAVGDGVRFELLGYVADPDGNPVALAHSMAAA